MKASTMQMQMSEMKDYNATEVLVGDVFVTASGVVLEINHINVGSLHLSKPTVWISYSYDDNGRTGTEGVSLENFLNNLAE